MKKRTAAKPVTIPLADTEVAVLQKLDEDENSARASLAEIAIQEEQMRGRKLQVIQTIGIAQQKRTGALRSKIEMAGHDGSSAFAVDLETKLITLG